MTTNIHTPWCIDTSFCSENNLMTAGALNLVENVCEITGSIDGHEKAMLKFTEISSNYSAIDLIIDIPL